MAHCQEPRSRARDWRAARPGTLSPNLIAPFFDDLILQRQDSNVSARLVGAAPDRRWVIDWQNLSIIDENGVFVGRSCQFPGDSL